jgi:hypothetical protein
MFAELFHGSQLLGFTLAALIIFIAVFAALAIRAMRLPVAERDAHARLPLEGDRHE